MEMIRIAEAIGVVGAFVGAGVFNAMKIRRGLASANGSSETNHAAVKTLLKTISDRISGVDERLGGIDDRLGRMEGRIERLEG